MGNELSKPQLYTRISKALPPIAPRYDHNENSDWVDKGVKAFASEGDREQFICTTCPSNTDALISLATSNGALNLENHDIKLFFSRRQYQQPQKHKPEQSQQLHHNHHQQQTQPPPSPKPTSPWRSLVTPSSRPEQPDDGTRLLATLVAIDEKGVITVKIEPEADGRTVAEAFQAFKRDVEIQLERLLRDVPNAAGGKVEEGERMGGRERPRGAVVPVTTTNGAAAAAVDKGLVDAPPAYGDVKKG